MVSKASEDFPEPDRPVITTSWSRGISTSMFLRLCSRAPRTTILSVIGLPTPSQSSVLRGDIVHIFCAIGNPDRWGNFNELAKLFVGLTMNFCPSLSLLFSCLPKEFG